MSQPHSLANKTLLIFGGAVVLIVMTALVVPWLRMTALIDAGQQELSRQLVDTWRRLGALHVGSIGTSIPIDLDKGPDRAVTGPIDRGGIVAREFSIAEAKEATPKDDFVRRALMAFEKDSARMDWQDARWVRTSREYRYAAALRGESGGRLTGMIVLERRSIEATRLLLVNTGFLLSAGSVVLLFSLTAFYIITHKLILGPVRALRETAERVRRGNLAIRSEITTGDEFQELAETFNSMLTDMQAAQDQLKAINAALDLKLNELVQSNSALFEAAKLKGEFLANVSHELRTPLNSIIGFAELLLEIARSDAAGGDPSPVVLKRIRYCENIVSAGRNLLSMINSLLEMAKIEAGRIDLQIAPMNLRDACEALLGLAYPLAEKRGVQLKLEMADDLPIVHTDVKKFQQIIFNFLSNAVKFTEPFERSGRVGQVTLRAERLPGGVAGEGGDLEEKVRVSVIDNGPGIPAEEQSRIFEKFHQLDNSHTREHTGTGLGLAISKELAGILRAEIQVVSEVGRGSMFSLMLPLKIDSEEAAESTLESKFRGALAGRRDW